jgi:hypothetical protein
MLQFFVLKAQFGANTSLSLCTQVQNLLVPREVCCGTGLFCSSLISVRLMLTCNTKNVLPVLHHISVYWSDYCLSCLDACLFCSESFLNDFLGDWSKRVLISSKLSLLRTEGRPERFSPILLVSRKRSTRHWIVDLFSTTESAKEFLNAFWHSAYDRVEK